MLGLLKTILKRRARKVIRGGLDIIDRFRPSPPPFDGRVPPPDFVTIETTRYCNLTCRMCLPFLDGITVTGPHIELEKFRRYAEQIFPFVKRFQPSVSGEPLMTKGFPEMIALARHYGVKLEIVTNGTLLNDRMADLLLPCTAQILFSFDGADKETFEHVRRDAVFEHVVENIRKFAQKAKKLPANQRPTTGLNMTIMRRNVRQLPAVIRLARDLGLDYVTAGHVFPATDEIRQESLFHDQDLARACIDEAEKTAKEIGICLTILPLDHCTAANALADGQARQVAAQDGIVPGLAGRTVGRMPPEIQGVIPGDPDQSRILERRKNARDRSHYPRPARYRRSPEKPQPIWVCEFLWSKTYIQLEGGVRPCCMPGPPELGSLEKETFEGIWNGDAYREMRQRLVVRDPIPVCKGCQHIREIKDPQLINKWLQGQTMPSAGDVVESWYSKAPANGVAASASGDSRAAQAD